VPNARNDDYILLHVVSKANTPHTYAQTPFVITVLELAHVAACRVDHKAIEGLKERRRVASSSLRMSRSADRDRTYGQFNPSA